MAGDDAAIKFGWRATGAGFAAILLWSLSIALVRSLSEQLGVVTGAAMVYGVAGGVALVRLALNGRRRRQITRLPRLYLVVCGALFTGYMLLLYFAIDLAADRQQVLEVGLLNYLWPAFTLLFSVVLLKKRARAIWMLPGTLMALGGIWVVLAQGRDLSWASFVSNLMQNPLAYSLGFGAAVFWALYSVLTRRWAGTQVTGAVDVFLPATAAILLILCIVVDEPRAWDAKSSIEAVFFGLATLIAYGCWDYAMRRGNVVLVAASSYLTPLFSTIVSSLYLSVAPASSLWLGCGLLIAGSLLSWRSVLNAPDERR